MCDIDEVKLREVTNMASVFILRLILRHRIRTFFVVNGKHRLIPVKNITKTSSDIGINGVPVTVTHVLYDVASLLIVILNRCGLWKFRPLLVHF